jgi:hypothetical protein
MLFVEQPLQAQGGVSTMPAEKLPDYVIGLSLIGAGFFGIVVGWVTYGSLRRAKRNGLTDITTVIGAIGGAAVTKLFPTETGAFGAYCIGLAIGFFGYLLVYRNAPEKARDWMGETPVVGGNAGAQGGVVDHTVPPLA